jgi:hypothetical protein
MRNFTSGIHQFNQCWEKFSFLGLNLIYSLGGVCISSVALTSFKG